MTRLKNTRTKLTRLGQILRVFMEKECVTNMPVFVKIDEAVPMDSLLLNRIIKAIRGKKQAGFRYDSGKGFHTVIIESYRIAYFGGFWYLIGKELSTGIMKRYALDKIGNLKLPAASSGECARCFGSNYQKPASGLFPKTLTLF